MWNPADVKEALNDDTVIVHNDRQQRDGSHPADFGDRGRSVAARAYCSIQTCIGGRHSGPECKRPQCRPSLRSPRINSTGPKGIGLLYMRSGVASTGSLTAGIRGRRQRGARPTPLVGHGKGSRDKRPRQRAQCKAYDGASRLLHRARRSTRYLTATLTAAPREGSPTT